MMAIANHAAAERRDRSRHATGGASVNRAILQVWPMCLASTSTARRVENRLRSGPHCARITLIDWPPNRSHGRSWSAVSPIRSPATRLAEPKHVAMYAELRRDYAMLEGCTGPRSHLLDVLETTRASSSRSMPSATVDRFGTSAWWPGAESCR